MLSRLLPLNSMSRTKGRSLTTKTTFQEHPDYTAALASNPAARRSRVEVHARGTTFSGERGYPKGSPSPDPVTYMTDEELIAKFRHNVEGVVSDADAAAVVEAVYDLENVDDISTLLNRLAPDPTA